MIREFIENGRQELVVNVNVNCMNLAYESENLRRILNEAPVVFATARVWRLRCDFGARYGFQCA